MLGHHVFGYLDDLIVVSEDVPTDLTQLQLVLDKLLQAGLKIKLSKCEF